MVISDYRSKHINNYVQVINRQIKELCKDRYTKEQALDIVRLALMIQNSEYEDMKHMDIMEKIQY